jgi:hypothetical protein
MTHDLTPRCKQLLTHCASMHHDNLPVFTDNLTISLIRVMP